MKKPKKKKDKKKKKNKKDKLRQQPGYPANQEHGGLNG